eukprot:TRINITY_DN75998_c0_g1_i1.p1 TRINITY_DN75998_c0_g1~~TRINITY_DN75998_c0_g1_i1.p1  ORF type:complete len:995 (-),score=96.91 TRINITY_DN75998_c0_g1_i1:116-2905(-)
MASTARSLEIVIPPELDCTGEVVRRFRAILQISAIDGFRENQDVLFEAEAFISAVRTHTYPGGLLELGMRVFGPGRATESEIDLSAACIFGLINALAIKAQHSTSRQESLHWLHRAIFALNYDRFDFIGSTTWPWTSFELLQNYAHEFQIGFVTPATLGWRGDSPPDGGVFFSSLPGSPTQNSLERGHQLLMFVLDTHASVSAELMWIFGASPIQASFEYHSFDPRCYKYRPHLCDPEVDPLIKELLPIDVTNENAIIDVHQDFETTAKRFYSTLRVRLALIDVFVCSMPALWCLLFQLFQKPILGLIPQTLTLWVPKRDRRSFLQLFVEIQARPDVVFAVTHQFLAEQVVWQTNGFRLPVARYVGANTGATYELEHSEQSGVLVGKRPSIHFQELIRRFAELNADALSFHFVFMADLPTMNQSMRDYCAYRAVVYLAYDVNTMMLHELYTCGIPMWVPADLWRHASRFGELYAEHLVFEGISTVAPGHPFPPFIPDRQFLDPHIAMYWSAFHEARRLPHLGRFESIPDLLTQLEGTTALELRSVSARMAEWTHTQVQQERRFWVDALTIVTAHDIVEEEIWDGRRSQGDSTPVITRVRQVDALRGKVQDWSSGCGTEIPAHFEHISKVAWPQEKMVSLVDGNSYETMQLECRLFLLSMWKTRRLPMLIHEHAEEDDALWWTQLASPLEHIDDSARKLLAAPLESQFLPFSPPLRQTGSIFFVGGHPPTELAYEWACAFAADVHLFQPAPDLLARLLETTRTRQSCADRVHYHPFALGQQTAMLNLTWLADYGSHGELFFDSLLGCARQSDRSTDHGCRRLFSLSKAAAESWRELGISDLELLHLECYGCEWSVIESLYSSGLLAHVRHVQLHANTMVQPVVENVLPRDCLTLGIATAARARMKLGETHEWVSGLPANDIQRWRLRSLQ